MRVTKLEAQNILKFRAVEITPKVGLNEIKGKNHVGKTSLINIICMAFGGKKEFPDAPIHKGAKKGTSKVHVSGDPALGIPNFTIIQTITDKTATTTISPDEFLKGETPRSFLDKIKGKIGFDPWDFIRLDKQKQRKILLDLIGLDADAMDREEKRVFDDRTVAGRELKTQEIKVTNLPYHSGIADTVEVSVAELSKKLTEATLFNNSLRDRLSANGRLKEEGLKLKTEIAELEEKLITMREDLQKKRDRYNQEKTNLETLEPIDTTILTEQIQTSEDTNAKIRDNTAYQSESTILQQKQTAYDEIDKNLECIRENKLKAIQAANIPVPGLTFDSDGLLYNGFPVAQCSTSEQMMIGTIMGMKLNPTVKILMFKDGSLLDAENKEILRKILKDEDYQCFFEEICSSREEYGKSPMGIYIEEDGVAIVDGEEVQRVKECAPELPKKQSKKVDKVENSEAPESATQEDW